MSQFDGKITLYRNTLQLQPRQHPDRARLLDDLADLLFGRFWEVGEMIDLNEAIALHEEALSFRPEGHPDRAHSLDRISDRLHERFIQSGILSDLEEALVLERDALALRPEGHPQRGQSLGNIAVYLKTRFSRFGGISDLEEAIVMERKALELFPQGDSHRAISLGNIGEYLRTRFNTLGNLSDLQEALTLQHSALELLPQGHPNRAQILAYAAVCHYSRFKWLGALSDLEEALSLEYSALELRPYGHPHRAFSLGSIARLLRGRFDRLGRLSDLDEAIALERSGLELLPQSHFYRADTLGNIAGDLLTRFERVGMLSDLEEALVLQRNALELRPQGHPREASSLSGISRCLYERFKRFGKTSDLEEALALERNALELRPQGHADRALTLGNLASRLYSRFGQLGMLSDLEEALALERNALELRQQDHPDRALSLGNLAAFIFGRFGQLGRPSDLKEAIALERSALELRPQDHSGRALSLGNLSAYLWASFEQFGRLSDLEEALSLQRSALELRPQGHPNRAMSLLNIANCLTSRFDLLGNLSDLEEAISLQRAVLELLPQGHHERADSLDNIANSLHTRFELLGSLSDIEEAISIQRSALELRPQGHLHHAWSLGNLARFLYARYNYSPVRDIGDFQEMFDLYSKLSDVSHTVFSADLKCAKEWIQRAEECDHQTTVLAYQTFFRLSVHHLATLPSLPENLSLLKQLMTSVPLDAFSACIRHGDLTGATELLEQGRGVFWSQLTRLRSPLDDVVASGDVGKKLADRFTQVASSLRSLQAAPSDAESQHDQALHLNMELQGIIADIRELPGLSRFLQPPLFSDLREAAAGGPVIIANASRYSCDALVLLPDRDPVHVGLNTTRARISELSLEFRAVTSHVKFMDVTRGLVVLLRELWDDVVYSIVKILQQHCPRRSRIWWCPTAEFSFLPLHAAGSYRKGQPNLSSLYISSYTPTLTALIRARQKWPSDTSVAECHRFLIIGQAQAPGQNKLPSVESELSSISQRAGSLATVTCIQDRDASVDKVGKVLNENEFVHLACHGIPDQKRPFESGFALCDGLLKVEHIMRYDLRNAKFAYLSACHTTVGDEESPDEVIHLAAAMQFAGFCSVIGTMWAVDDAHTNQITSKFYENMMEEAGHLDHTHAALALHKTMRGIRSSDVPLDQRILYVHIGA